MPATGTSRTAFALSLPFTAVGGPASISRSASSFALRLAAGRRPASATGTSRIGFASSLCLTAVGAPVATWRSVSPLASVVPCAATSNTVILVAVIAATVPAGRPLSALSPTILLVHRVPVGRHRRAAVGSSLAINICLRFGHLALPLRRQSLGRRHRARRGLLLTYLRSLLRDTGIGGHRRGNGFNRGCRRRGGVHTTAASVRKRCGGRSSTRYSNSRTLASPVHTRRTRLSRRRGSRTPGVSHLARLSPRNSHLLPLLSSGSDRITRSWRPPLLTASASPRRE